LDEPTIGLDVVMQQKIRDFIKEYNHRYGATIILTSHYMDDVKELCRRVIIINGGRMIYDGRLDEIVRRYADWKVLLAVFEQPVARSRLDALGEVVSYEPLRAAIRVPRAEIAARAAGLLAEFPVADVTIQETEVEDVIRRIFSEDADVQPGLQLPVVATPS
jgi:ABC-2 type transport system ATP-binding protein